MDGGNRRRIPGTWESGFHEISYCRNRLRRAYRGPRISPCNPPGTWGGLLNFHDNKFIISVAVRAYRYWCSSTSIIEKTKGSAHDTEQEIGLRLRGADNGACRGHVGCRRGHRWRPRALSVPRRSNLRRQCEVETTISSVPQGPRPFQPLWDARPTRAGRQSPAPRRSRQLDTVIRVTANAGLRPSCGIAICWLISPEDNEACWQEFRHHRSAIAERPSSAGFLPSGARKSRSAIRHRKATFKIS